MKILYCGISSKFIHSMPAGWFLCEYLESKGIFTEELYLNVNQPYDKLLDQIISRRPQVLLFSVYIFNTIVVTRLISDIKKKFQECKIIVGGPEVDKDFEADHIIIGEGEKALYKLLTQGGDKVIFQDIIENLDDIPSPYTEDRLQQCRHKLLYYESSRGCPFRCSYCMASLSRGVRYFSLNRVKKDLVNIVKSGARVIKFTDRTFNANTKRTNEILQFILEQFFHDDVCFHFEVGGDLFQQSTLKLLKKLPIGRVQIEAGVQTLNPKTLKSIDRVFDERVFISNIATILKQGNIHTHLDLIAGLPYDDIEMFIFSFNKVMELSPHNLQLGFLKFLKGTKLRRTYKAEYHKEAPYEIISSPDMKIPDIQRCKAVEFVLNRIYNSGKFINTMKYLLSQVSSPFHLFEEISYFFQKVGIKSGEPENNLYRALAEKYVDIPFFEDLLRFDFLTSNNSKRLPPSLKREYSVECKRFLAQHKRTKDIMFDCFHYHPLTRKKDLCFAKFDYSKRNPVTGQYAYEFILR